MSQHPSLSSSDKDKKQRSVLKRHERIKLLKDKEKWTDGDSVFGLPKVKVIKYRIKKEKAQVAETAPGAVAAAPGAGAAPSAPPAKGAPQSAAKAAPGAAKAAPSKESAKPRAGGEKK